MALTQVSRGLLSTSIDDNGNSTAITIDSSEKVGIGTISPTYTLSVNSGSSTVPASLESTGGDSWLMLKDTNTTLGNVRLGSSSNNLIAYAGGSERMRIDNVGTLLVNRTTVFTTAKMEIQSDAGDASTLALNSINTDGSILEFYKAGANVGSILSYGASRLSIASGDVGLVLAGDLDSLYPSNGQLDSRGSAVDLGLSSVRFDDVFCVNVNESSDRNLKQDIEELSEAEKRVAVTAKGLLRKYRLLSSVLEKGDDARIHFGIIAQDLQAAFEAEGLDPSRYAMWCSDTWTDEDTGEEVTRQSIRYTQLLAFIISAI